MFSGNVKYAHMRTRVQLLSAKCAKARSRCPKYLEIEGYLGFSSRALVLLEYNGRRAW